MQPWKPGLDPRETERVLRAFTRDGRIVSMPAKWSRKLVLMDVVAQSFEPGLVYDEADVNFVLRDWYDDYAALRRYLVDAGMLSREDGRYWRSGGTVPRGAARGRRPRSCEPRGRSEWWSSSRRRPRRR